MSKSENKQQPTISQALQEAIAVLQTHQREERVAELLLLFHLGMNKTELLMNMRESMDPVLYAAFRKDVEEHVETGIPLQHLTGEEEFLGRRFYVNRDVLIPRPETEELVLGVEKLIQQQLAGQDLTIADIGTGSGIIATSLKLAFPKAENNDNGYIRAGFAYRQKRSPHIRCIYPLKARQLPGTASVARKTGECACFQSAVYR